MFCTGNMTKNMPRIYDLIKEGIECMGYIGYVAYIAYIGYSLYTQEAHSCKMYQLGRESEKVVGARKTRF